MQLGKLLTHLFIRKLASCSYNNDALCRYFRYISCYHKRFQHNDNDACRGLLYMDLLPDT